MAEQLIEMKKNVCLMNRIKQNKEILVSLLSSRKKVYIKKVVLDLMLHDLMTQEVVTTVSNYPPRHAAEYIIEWIWRFLDGAKEKNKKAICLRILMKTAYEAIGYLCIKLTEIMDI